MKKLATKTVLTLLSTLTFAAFASTGHAQGDAAAGQSKAAVCGACHGATGDSAIAANPKLAGQNANYLFKQLQDIKSGAQPDFLAETREVRDRSWTVAPAPRRSG